MQLPVKGLSCTNRLSIAAKTLEDRHGANCEAPKRSQVRLCTSGNGSFPRLSSDKVSVSSRTGSTSLTSQPLAISGLQLALDQPSISP
jgi:hypothetical protein